LIVLGVVIVHFLSSQLQAAKGTAQRVQRVPRVVSSNPKKSAVYRISARSAILLDITHGKRFFGKNIDTKVHPASTTKVMTALLVLEHLSLDTIVTVSPGATGVQPSKLNLQAGEQYKVSDLLYGILLNSANDASIVLAEAVSGSEPEFVKLMNKRAKELGARHTRFVNSNGLPTPRDSQYTTVYDMSLIFARALEHDFFADVVRHPYKTIYSTAGKKINLKNHNKMLFTDWGAHIYGKTGYTKAAQSCFVGFTMKKESTLVVAVFGCSRRWKDIRYIIRKYGGIVL